MNELNGFKEITEEQWFDALGQLPPLSWNSDEYGFTQRFFCMEFQWGTQTDCYVKVHDKYFAKTVDYYDEKALPLSSYRDFNPLSATE
jgi:hypothetical protein